MSGRDDEPRAFAPDRALQAVASVLKAAWWGSAGAATRALARPGRDDAPVAAPKSAPAPKGFARQAWLEAFEKDRRDVALGLYPVMGAAPRSPVGAINEIVDLLTDAREVEARRRRNGATEARADTPPGDAYPAYYRRNFHFQTGGWFTAESARRYEAQVETLFAGTAGAMRRRALSLLATAWRERDQRDLRLLELACGAGGFLADLDRAFPRAQIFGVDLSLAYLQESRLRSGVQALAQANAEKLPFADGAMDAVTCVYLFHELPARARTAVAAEIARVLKPGGLLALADAIQPEDEPAMARLLEMFPAFFHEPFFADYRTADLPRLFGEAGLEAVGRDQVFLTKAILFEKREGAG